MTIPSMNKLNTVFPIMIDKYEQFIPNIEGMGVPDKINAIIQYLNRIGKLSNDVVADWNKVMVWVMDEGLTDSVNAKIDDLIAKGLFDELLNGMMDDLNTANTAFQNSINSQETTFQNTINGQVNTLTTQLAESVTDLTLTGTKLQLKKANGATKGTGIDIPTVGLDDTSTSTSKTWSSNKINTVVGNIGNASPKSVYATLSALQTAFPTGTTGIYVVSADGQWYYWNGSSWTAGGTYQSTGFANDSVTYVALKNNDTDSLGDFVTTTGSAGASLWIPQKKFRAGFLNKVTVKAQSTVTNARISFYKLRNTSDLIIAYSKTFSLVAGNNDISLNVYMDEDFYVGIGADTTGIAYIRDDVNGNPIATATISNYGDLLNTAFTVNAPAKYSYGVQLEYLGLKKMVDENFLKSKTLTLFEHALLMKKATTGSIKLDFENMVLTIDNIYLNRKDNLSSTKVANYLTLSVNTPLSSFPAEGYYVVYVLFNTSTKVIELVYSNGETLVNYPSEDQTKKYMMVCGGITDGKTYFNFINSPNNNLVTAILKQTLNTDDGTTSTDIIIPKFGERLYITEVKQANTWFGKTVNLLGDSVTKGENSANSYLRMKDDNIASILKEEFGFATSRNYGIGGSRITTHSDGNFAKKGMVDRYSDMLDADLVIVWGGTNDFGNNVPMGTLTTLTDNTQFKPAFYNLLNGLQTKYPGKQILVITPMHRNDSKPENVANTQGLLLKDYRDAEISICEMLGIPYLDMWTELGITPFNTTMKTTYMPDGLHPSIVGMRTYVGRRICNKVRNF